MTYAINKLAIVTNTGHQQGIARTTFSLSEGVIVPPTDCANPYDFGNAKPNELFPNAKKQFTVCFPPFTEEDEIVFYIDIIEDAEIERLGDDIFNYRIIGNKEEYSFVLTSLI